MDKEQIYAQIGRIHFQMEIKQAELQNLNQAKVTLMNQVAQLEQQEAQGVGKDTAAQENHATVRTHQGMTAQEVAEALKPENEQTA